MDFDGCELKSARNLDLAFTFDQQIGVNKTDKERSPRKPDGGCTAWVVVAASFMISLIQEGFIYSFGLLLPRISDRFSVGRAESSLISSIFIFLTFGSGPLVAVLTTRFGHRLVTIVGVIFSTAGLLTAAVYIHLSSSPSIFVIYVTIGLLTGVGFGLMYLPAWDIIEVYFDKKLGLATGIAAAGAGIGEAIFSPVFHYAELHLGLEGTLYILAGVVASGIIFGYLFKPLKQDKEVENNVDNNGNINKGFTVDKTDSVFSQELKPEKIKEEETNDDLASQFVVFKSIPMVLLMISHFLMHFGIFATYAFMTDRAQQQFGISAEKTSVLLSVMGACNFVGKIGFGTILDKFRNQTLVLTSIILLINASSILMAEFWTSFIGQVVCAVLFGISIGSYDTSIILVFKVFSEDITSPLGVSMFVFAIASLVGPTSVGHLYDVTGSFTPGFLLSSSLSFLGMILLPIIIFIARNRQK